MFILKATRIKIYSQLFRDGVIVCKKDSQGDHPEMEGVPNLQVWKLMQSLKSKGYVRETYNWRYLYYYLENEGIEYLREYLGITDANVVPDTHKKAAVTARAPGQEGEGRTGPGGYGDKGGRGFRGGR